MKVECDFCKTKYSLDNIPAMPVKCAICGYKWMIKTPSHKNYISVVLAALCALLSAVIFAIVVVTHVRSTNSEAKSPLVASITKTEMAPDSYGINHFTVSGIIENRSTEIYGAPNLIVMTYDDDGNQINSIEQFNPPVTLLDAGARAEFTYTLRAPSVGVKKIVVKFVEFEK